jgi:hypothetical protein
VRRFLLSLLLVFAACGGDSAKVTVVVVTLDAQPGVPPPSEVTVTVRNGSDMVARMFMAAPVTFPSTFSVTPHDRTGALTVDAEASAPDGRTAHGTGQVDIVPAGRADVHVVLVPDDYVLNSRRAGAQVTSFGLGARQLAAAGDGSFTVIYEDTCPQNLRCDIWSRLFDAGGAPRTNRVNQDATDFIVNSSPMGTLTQPTIAQLNGGGFLGGWKLLDAPIDLRIRVFDRDANPIGAGEQSVLATTTFDREPGGVMAAALDHNRFLVVWQQERNLMPGVAEPLYIHARVVTADGMLLGEFQVNTNNPPAGNLHANDDHVAPFAAVAPDGSFVITWVRGSATCIDTLTAGPCEVRARWFDSSGNLGPEASVAATPSNTQILPVAASTGDGFVFAWSDKLASGPDTDDYAVVARKFDRAGTPLWPNQEVLDTLTAGAQSAPALASGPGEQLLAVWTDCSMAGIDMDGCGIRGRALQPFGLPVGDDFQINTTTQGRQDNASVVSLAGATFFAAWTDSGMSPPDTDGSVRGRFITPAFDRTDGVVGAVCDVDHPCGNNLVCTPHGAGNFCHVACAQVGQLCDSGGTCQASTGPTGGTSCQFP